MKVKIVKDANFEKVADGARPDSKRRVVLPKCVSQGVTYHIYTNSIGQIVLDPQVTMPASEAWLFKNKEAMASVRRGLSDAAKGKISKVDLSSL